VNSLRQFFVVTMMVLRTIPQRLGWSLAAALGIAFVVMVMVAVFSIAEGFRATMENTGARDTALVLRSGSDSEMASTLQLETTRIVADAPGVLRGARGLDSLGGDVRHRRSAETGQRNRGQRAVARRATVRIRRPA
jgi:putative ABC transport system permease protein